MTRRTIQIWLDDQLRAPFGMVGTNTVEDTIELLKKCSVRVLSLDHDLGYSKTGYDVLLWIEKEIVANPEYDPPGLISIHSMNLGARAKMGLAITKITDLMEKRK